MVRRSKTVYDGPGTFEGRRVVDEDQWEGNWMSQDPVDMAGRDIHPGDWVVKGFSGSRAVNIEVRRVREVRPVKERKRDKYDPPYDPTPRVYLSDSTVPVEYPGRLLVIPWDPAKGWVPGLDPV